MIAQSMRIIQFRKGLLATFIHIAATSCVLAQESPLNQLSFANSENPDPINIRPAYQANLTGNRIVLGVFDSGIDPNQPAFSNNKILGSFGYRCSSGVCRTASINDFNALGDVNGHGTGVASIIAGSSIRGTVSNIYDRSVLISDTSMSGIAYNARLVIGQQVFEEKNEIKKVVTAGTTDAQTAASLNYIVNQNGLKGQRVVAINNSWGVTPTTGKDINQNANEYIDTSNKLTRLAIIRAQQAGIVQVWAAGNDNHAFPGTPASMVAANNYGDLSVNQQTINVNNPDATMPLAWIAVASTTNRGFKADGSVEMADTYTNKCGATRYYCISAPGGIAQPATVKTLQTGAKLAQAYPNQYSNNNIIGISEGTSQAAPVVTGAIALVAQQFPWMAGDNLSTTILTTGTSAENPSEIFGRGMLDVGKAIKGPGIFEADFSANLTDAYTSTFSNNISGEYGLIKAGQGVLILSGKNTYSGMTSVKEGQLTLAHQAQILGSASIDPAATLKSGGYIAGALTVNGRFIPGNSPGFSHVGLNLTIGSSGTYQQDISGVTQARPDTPPGNFGFYSFLQADSEIIIHPGATLAPTLRDVFDVNQPGYGSSPYLPALGDQFRIATARLGLVGRFSSIVQPTMDLSNGTQFVVFYNMDASNSLDMAIVPSSYTTTITAASGNTNALSVGSVLDQVVNGNVTGSSTVQQDQLLYTTSGQTSAAGISSYAQGLSGEVYAAAVASIPQTTLRVQQAVLNRLSDTMRLSLTQPISPVDSQGSLSNRGFWGDLSYQKTNRSSDSISGGWNSNLYQLVFGLDRHTEQDFKLGVGFALSNTTLNPIYGSGTIQQGSLFVYGKYPVQGYFLDAMASIGLSYSDLSRSDVTGGSGFRNKNISGNDALVSLGLSRPIDLNTNLQLTPFTRLTWQWVTQSGVNEGDAFAALNVNRFNGNAIRGVVGAALSSKANNPMTDRHTFRAFLGLGADSSGLLNPSLNASLVGYGTNISTPAAGALSVQAGLYGTMKFARQAYAFAGLSGEARSGQTVGVVNAGVWIQF
ncbi:S8 family peptidase [Zwartia sp.]|uniref:S8 family peptidase n=1 Tax=Zwartia sp. TaxID=2978004 RepID=UPI00271CAC94|nr:S8 family serine peptidase [Zwartia sp.]MDO9023758.1 S8 family serine peptidase [Zwartia sp.]